MFIIGIDASSSVGFCLGQTTVEQVHGVQKIIVSTGNSIILRLS